jgi:plasmid stabilization system protein ParE
MRGYYPGRGSEKGNRTVVRWTAPARADPKKIFAYIAEDSKYYAKRVVPNIAEKTEAFSRYVDYRAQN